MLRPLVTFTAPGSNGGSAITGYTVTSNPGGITGTGSASPIIVTGLTNGNAYTFTVTATNANGTGPASSVSNSVTPTICGYPLTVTHSAGSVAPVTKTVTYGVVLTNLSGTNKCWITQNLGADKQAVSATDATEAARGWFWQFNLKQGYENDGTTLTPSTWVVPPISENSNWTTANDPCTILLGTGWRIPTQTEWINVDNSGLWNNYNDAYASVLKLHAAGDLNYLHGVLWNTGSFGSFWSSNQYYQLPNPGGWYLVISSSVSQMGQYSKAVGESVRCLKD